MLLISEQRQAVPKDLTHVFKSSFFLSFKKKKQGQYLAILTGQAWSIKGLLYGQTITPSLWERGEQARWRDRRDRPILPVRVANQNTGFALSCQLAEPAI